MLAAQHNAQPVAWAQLRQIERVQGQEVILVGGQRAKRAVSCLVAPEPGDEVAVIQTPKGLFVVGIITRPGAQNLRVEAPGEMDITAGQRLGLGSGGRLEMAAGGKFVIMAGGIELISRALRASLGVVRVGAGRVRMAASEVVSRLKRRLSSVEELERVEAGAIMHEASSVYSASAGTMALEAEGDVRIDGQMVQLG